MLHSVKNLVQGNNSTLMLTATPRHGANAITFQFTDYSFEEFQQFCELMQPKHIQLNTIQQAKVSKSTSVWTSEDASSGRGRILHRHL